MSRSRICGNGGRNEYFKSERQRRNEVKNRRRKRDWKRFRIARELKGLLQERETAKAKESDERTAMERERKDGRKQTPSEAKMVRV